MKKRYFKVVKAVETGVWGSAALVLITLAGLVSAELLLRNVFSYSLKIVEECSFIMLSYISYMSAAYAFRKKAHVAVDFLYGKMNNKIRLILYTLTYTGSIIFLGFVVKLGYEFAMNAAKIPLTISRIPKMYIYIWLPVGAVFMIFFIVCDLIETLLMKDRTSLMTTEERQIKDLEQLLLQEKEQEVSS